jgi:2-hydroxychromene-2-carboxylate isomerase
LGALVYPLEQFTIYHSPNAYIGSVLLRRAAAARSGMVVVLRPIMVPRSRGVKVTEMLGGAENVNAGSYNREDCQRWAERHGIPMVYPHPDVFRARAARWATARWEREELPARAYYASLGTGLEDRLDEALFEAAWVEGLDVNEPATIQWAAGRAGLDGDALLERLRGDDAGVAVRHALDAFDRYRCPGVPTFVVNGARVFGKDRLDWALDVAVGLDR